MSEKREREVAVTALLFYGGEAHVLDVSLEPSQDSTPVLCPHWEGT